MRDPLHEYMCDIVPRWCCWPRSLDPRRSHMARGKVWCFHCGNTRSVDSAACLRSGWPKCCGETMSIDSPEERAKLKDKELRRAAENLREKLKGSA